MLLDCKDRILLLDGAMGTQLQARFPDCSNFETLNLSHPEAVQAVHEAYIAAGADIIETNSFGANRISQEEYGLQDKAREMAFEAVRIARRAADKASREVLVAGSVGPTGKSLSLSSDMNNPAFRKYDFDSLAMVYAEQIEALASGGADIILIETCFDALNVKAALYAIDKLGLKLPVAVSVSVGDRSGRTLTGQTIEAFYRSVEHGRLWAFGLNCSLGAQELCPLVEDLGRFVSCSVLCYPNAGLPNELGEYDQSPEQMAAQMQAMASRGILNIAGGCCGTTPEHIAAIASALGRCPARKLPETEDNVLYVSGLEAVAIDKEHNNFSNIGERTNVAGSRKFARLIASGDYEQALQIAAGQIESGAAIIDVNMDDAMLDAPLQMQTFLRHISNDPAVAKAAIMVDSSDWQAVLQGLKNAQGKCIVNSISLKDGEALFLEKALEIKRLGAAMIVMAFDEQGQATDYERKISICERAYHLLTKKANIDPKDIIFDVNVLSIGTGIEEHRRYGLDFIEAVRWIKNNLAGVRTSGGISNLSFAFRGNNAVREAMHSAFLYHATAAGLDMGIVNPSMLQIYGEIEPDMLRKVEDVIFDRSPYATEALIAKAQELLDKSQSCPSGRASEQTAPSESPLKRLVSALVRGRTDTLRQDVLDSLEILGSAVAVVEGPLMEGMQTVGDDFGAGKMFLPQVVKSARIMREAIDILSPYMSRTSENSASSKPKFLIATVKGDVHDIGKNITAIVLNCNGFEITDLGVMAPREIILDKAQEIGADIIGVSGLITPSLFQMEELCRQMSERGMDIPLFVGGASASALHTALKLAPLYGHVFYGADASATAVMAKRCLMDRRSFEQQEHEKQAELREIARASRKSSASEADSGRQLSADGPFPVQSYLRGKFFDDIPFMELPFAQAFEFFDWRMFQAIWSSGDDPSLRSDAEDLIAHLRERDALSIRLAVKFFDAVREGDDIVFDEGRLPMLRQSEGERLCLADYLVSSKDAAAVSAGPALEGSPFGIFAVSVHTRQAHCNCAQCAAQYESMLLRSVKVTLAEAASSWIDVQLQGRLLREKSAARIVKPAAGYYSCPDHTLKADIMKLLPDSSKLEIAFTESYAMIPDASICGFIFAHPQAGYPEIRRLAASAVDEYARKRGFDEYQTRNFLGHLLYEE